MGLTLGHFMDSPLFILCWMVTFIALAALIKYLAPADEWTTTIETTRTPD